MTGVKCPKCKHINPDGQPVCLRCNTPLPRVRMDAPKASPPPESNQFRPGQIVAGRYTVLAMIGRGGMGCIYKVRDNVLKEDVALKTLLPQFVREKMVVERFFNEARIARSLSHPNIVRVHDIGMTGKIIYISMELVQGKSLRTILEEVPPGDRLPIQTTLKIMAGLCEALEYAHKYTVHRDIKPENVMVCHDGTVKLMDFGISKLMDSPGLTGTSMVMGTPYYMSPEQLKNSAGVDARADIYSVGVMLYEILTGNMPTGVPKPASKLTREVPPALDPIVAKCVEPDPIDRYQNVSDLQTALASLGRVLASPVKKPMPRARTAKEPLPARKIAGAFLILLVMGLAALGIYRVHDVQKNKPLISSVSAPAPSATQGPGFEEYAALIARIQGATLPSRPEVDALMQSADTFWEKHKAKGSPEVARQALQRYLAALWWRPDMVFIPPGEVSFWDGDKRMPVFVDGFFIDVTEVTSEKFVQFIAEYPSPRVNLYAEPDHPVTNVTYYDALAYAAWAGKQLPTEAQWARAAYGEAVSERYPWGDDWQEDACNAAGDSDGYEFTAPVKAFEDDKTWSGCYDMAGNVSEWTRSAFVEQLPYDPNDGREDPMAREFGSFISIRGGCYADERQTLLNTRRAATYDPAESALPYMGLRCVLELPKSLKEIQAYLDSVNF